jgi:hypothetical protein
VLCCQVYTVTRLTIDSNLHDTLDMGDGLFAESKRSNSTFIMLYLVHEMDIDYLVVDKMIIISKLFDYTCMFSIGCKPIMISTQTWLKLVKSA